MTKTDEFRAKLAAGQADWAMKTVRDDYEQADKVSAFRSKLAEGRADWAMKTISEQYDGR